MTDSTPSPGPLRPRAPTITIDTSATNDSNMAEPTSANPQESSRTPTHSHNASSLHSHSRQPSYELRAANSFDSKESRPTSPHNVSSPATTWNNSALLSVPAARSRGNSLDSVTEHGESNSSGTYVTSSQGDALKGDLGPTEIPSPEEALKPDPGRVRIVCKNHI